MITLHLKAHLELPIYINVKTFLQTDGVQIPAVETNWSLPHGKYTLHFTIGKIEPRDGHIAIYSSDTQRVKMTLNPTKEEVKDIWIPYRDSEILVLPNRH
jgi:hypothetical protein